MAQRQDRRHGPGATQLGDGNGGEDGRPGAEGSDRTRKRRRLLLGAPVGRRRHSPGSHPARVGPRAAGRLGRERAHGGGDPVGRFQDVERGGGGGGGFNEEIFFCIGFRRECDTECFFFFFLGSGKGGG